MLHKTHHGVDGTSATPTVDELRLMLTRMKRRQNIVLAGLLIEVEQQPQER